MANSLRCPRQSCPGIHLWVMCGGRGGGCPSGAVGPTGMGATLPLPGVPSGVGAVRNKLGNGGWEAVKAPPGSADPQRSLLAGAGEQTRFYRGDETQICASASPPFLQFPSKKKKNG